jgi:hypothetical protein
VKAEDAPLRVEGLLKAYLSHRTGATERFQDFSGLPRSRVSPKDKTHERHFTGRRRRRP